MVFYNNNNNNNTNNTNNNIKNIKSNNTTNSVVTEAGVVYFTENYPFENVDSNIERSHLDIPSENPSNNLSNNVNNLN